MQQSTPVPSPLEVEVEVQYASVIGALEAAPVGGFPLLVDNLKGNVLIGRTSREHNLAQVWVSTGVWHHTAKESNRNAFRIWSSYRGMGILQSWF